MFEFTEKILDSFLVRPSFIITIVITSGARPTDRHRSEYNSPSTVPFFITIVIIKEGRAKKV
jgi:hypothetical protein